MEMATAAPQAADTEKFEPFDTMYNQTFIGLLIAEFLAAFNDQAIHAAAMFFAIRANILAPETAIMLMPVIFGVPWVLFSTLAGYFADRYSKQIALTLWKNVEVLITAVAMLGFWAGSETGLNQAWGAWVCLSCVFLMGTHSTFYVPAKYGVMPELFKPQLLSRANGLLESLTFLAIILGTLTGGVLSYLFHGREVWIGVVLFVLAVVGAVCSYVIKRMPAANPNRPFPATWSEPWLLYAPAVENVRAVFRSKALALAVSGIAFSAAMVVFMRNTMYLHGETRVPVWTELHTSLVVGSVALGIGLGSPLAGFLSGRKIELGLIPLGGVGMAACLLAAGLLLDVERHLIVCIVLIGFFSGFYVVPLYTLLQHSAPKDKKGEMVATSNLVNVVGLIATATVFMLVIRVSVATGLAPEVPVKSSVAGRLESMPRQDEIEEEKFTGRLKVVGEDGRVLLEMGAPAVDGPYSVEKAGRVVEGEQVRVLGYERERQGRVVTYYRVQPTVAPELVYDKEPLTRYLFLFASVLPLAVLLMLFVRLPDMPVRTLLWAFSFGGKALRPHHANRVPSVGPALLVTDCAGFDESMLVLSCTDRTVRFVLPSTPAGLVPFFANRAGVVLHLPGEGDAAGLLSAAEAALRQDDLVAFSVGDGARAVELVAELQGRLPVPIVPVCCDASGAHAHVVFGKPLPPGASVEEARLAIEDLRAWLARGGAAAL